MTTTTTTTVYYLTGEIFCAAATAGIMYNNMTMMMMMMAYIRTHMARWKLHYNNNIIVVRDVAVSKTNVPRSRVRNIIV